MYIWEIIKKKQNVKFCFINPRMMVIVKSKRKFTSGSVAYLNKHSEYFIKIISNHF